MRLDMRRQPRISREFPPAEGILFEALEPRLLLSSVTVVAHGGNFFPGVNIPMQLIAGSVRTYWEGQGQTAATYSYDPSDGDLSRTGGSADADNKVVIFEWLDESNILEGGFDEAAGEALYAMLAGNDLLNSDYLHLIGHSRGTVVISETAQRLLYGGFDVDHLTFLDTEPGYGDMTAAGNAYAWEGVGFVDNYYGDGMPFFVVTLQGEPVSGAHDVYLSGVDHIGVATWYNATINDVGATEGYYWRKDPADQAGATVTGSKQSILGASRPEQVTRGIVNGYFDYGTVAGWDYQGGGGDGSIGSSLHLYSGNASREHNRIYVPVDSGNPKGVYLTFSATVADTSADDAFAFTLRTEGGLVTDNPGVSLAAPSGWTTYSVDLTPYAGQALTFIPWIVEGGGSVDSEMWLDNFKLEYSPIAPDDLAAARIDAGRVDLTWNDNSTDETGFRIERKTGAGSWSEIATVGAGAETYSDTTVSAANVYTYRVRSYNAVGNSPYSNEATAPTWFLLTDPAGGATYGVGDIVPIDWTSGNVIPGATVSLNYDEDATWLNGNEHWIEVDRAVGASGAGQWLWNTRNVTPGTYYLSGYLYDWIGTTASDHTAQTVTLVSRSFALTGPTSGTYTAGETIDIGWTASRVGPGGTITLAYDEDTTWLNGNEHWIEIDALQAADGSASYTWNTRNVQPGTYYLAGYLYDPNGTFLPSQLTQAITIVAPTFVLSDPASGTYTVGEEVTIEWTAGNVLSGSTLSLAYDEDMTWLNGNEHWIEIDGVPAATGAGSWTWTTRGVTPGTYYIAGYLHGRHGDPIASQLTGAITIEAGVIPPPTPSATQTFALTGPQSATHTVGEFVPVTWTASDVTSGGTITVGYDEDATWLNGNEHWIEVDRVAAVDGSGTWLWNTTGVAPGTYYMIAYLYDWQGTAITSQLTQPVTLAAQSFTLTGPTTGPVVVGDNVTIEWTAGNVLPGSTISLYYDEDTTALNGNEHWIEIDLVSASDGSGSFIWNTRNVAPGTYYVGGYMYDWSGTTVLSQIAPALTISNQVFSITSPTSGTYSVGDVVTILWTTSNVRTGSTVSLYYDEDTTAMNGNEHWIEIDAVYAASGTWQWTTWGVTPGTYTLGGYLYDWNGRVTSSHLTSSFTIV